MALCKSLILWVASLVIVQIFVPSVITERTHWLCSYVFTFWKVSNFKMSWTYRRQLYTSKAKQKTRTYLSTVLMRVSPIGILFGWRLSWFFWHSILTQQYLKVLQTSEQYREQIINTIDTFRVYWYICCPSLVSSFIITSRKLDLPFETFS